MKLTPSLLSSVEEWFAGKSAEALTGRPLTWEEGKLARSKGVKFPWRVRVKTVAEIPIPAWLRLVTGFYARVGGLCCGYGILMTENCLAHELVHVAQYERLGAAFVATYLQQVLEHGYWDAPMEREARE